MSATAQTTRLPLALLVLGFVVYGLGAYLTRLYLCQPLGAWVLLAGVVLGALSPLLLIALAMKERSWAVGIGAAAIAFVVVFLYLFIGVLTLPGCSGV